MALTTVSAWAQAAGTGTLTGTVTDPAGAVVPGASVVVTNTGTGVATTQTSNDAGIYTATFLQPGTYGLTVSKPGFKTIDRQGVTVEVGRTVSIDFQMQVGDAGATTVSITEEAPVVDAEKTEVSQEVSQSMVTNLPLVGRRWDNLVLLTPGTTADGGLVSYRGISGIYNNNQVDGANNNQAFFSEARGRSNAPYTYSMDAIQEYQVATSNYSAEFGQAAGGVVNAVTKSGTNLLHGDLFYFLRYPTLNALDPVNKSKGIYTQPVHQQQQFGGSVGGSIIKDKLFYFVNYDGYRKVFPIAYISTATFPFACPAAVTASQCGAANSYLTSLTGSYGRTGVNDVALGKLDYQLNSTNRLSAVFNWADYHAPNAYNSSATVSNNSITANAPYTSHTRSIIAKWDQTITPNLLNNIRFQWAVDNEIYGANDGGPSVTIASVMAYGMPNALPRPAFPDEHRLEIADTLSWIHGRHQIKAGYDFNTIHELLINLFQGGGIYNYSGSATAAFNGWVEDVYGINVGDGLTGRHYSSFTQVTDPITGVGKDDFVDRDYDAFVEDTWKARSNLTIDMGLRYEIQTVPQPPSPNLSGPLNAYLTSKINIDSNNFGPRIGLSWEPMKGFVVRAGYGMFYGKTTNSTFYTIRVENGVYQQTFNCSPTSCPSLTFPNVIFTPPGPTPAAPFTGALTPRVTPFTPPASGQLSRGLPHDFVNPLVHEGDITLEKQLPGNSSFTAAWLFSRGLHLPAFVDANLQPASQTHTYGVLDASNNLQQTLTLPWYTQRIDNSTGDILTGYSVVNSLYNALALTYHRRMTNGFEALVNYTFSKSTDDGAVNGANGTFNGTDYTVDPKNQKAEYSVSDLYQKHRLTGSLIYQPTVFHQLSNKFAKGVLDGWMISSTFTVASPLPVFALISGFPSGGLDYGLTGGTVTNTGGSTGGRPPQVSRNAYFGATQIRDVDLRVMREFPVVRDRVRLQFMAEAFNMFNHSIISSVNGTAFNFTASSATSATCPTSKFNGCISPNSAFLAPTSSLSTNGLYGARQMEFAAKIVF